ncbi:MAG: protein kinase [Tannerellaceae bacterium]|nr:protein kinase [Tannerellaceae bacterium]
MASVLLQNESDLRSGRYYEFDPENKADILGKGGMGIVFKGRLVHGETGKYDYVAIKVLFKDLSEESVTRAQREASIRIVHENIVRMYDFVETTDTDGKPRYHVISEYLEGETLDKLIKKSGILSQAEAVKIVKSILAALYMLHSKGFIHRDIDPSNVMVCKDGKIKLIDFGIAKQVIEYQDEFGKGTQEGKFIGKINYASPEQAEGKHWLTNVASDIYSTGILLFELLTGKLPFTGTMYEIIKGHREQVIPRNDSLSRELQYVIRKATAKDPAQRYQSATEFIVDLEQIEKGKSPIPRPLKKWIYGAAVVCLALLTGFSVWRYQEGRHARFGEALSKASAMMQVAMYQDALDLYREANEAVVTDSVSQTIKMLETLTLGVAAYIDSEYAAADSLFNASDSLGSSDACYYLGEMSYEGIGTPKDFRRGFEYTSRAAAMGNKLAEYRLGFIYQNGIDVEADHDKAIRYFESAGRIIDRGTEANNPEFQYVKAGMYMHGNGVQQNSRRAIEYYESAAVSGYPQAQYELYEILDREDHTKAMEWLTTSAERGYPKAAFRLGVLLIGQQKFREGFDWTTKAAEKNYSPAFRQLGAIYQEKGKTSLAALIQQTLGIKGDDSVSHLYTVKALDYDFDNYMAMYDIGMDYLRGNGVKEDKAEAVKYFDMARHKVEQLPFTWENGRRIYNEIQHPFAEEIRTFDYTPYIK